MKVETHKSGHVFERYILERISGIEGAILLPRSAMEVLMDEDGAYWLCDKGVEREEDLETQGCWKCRDKFVNR